MDETNLVVDTPELWEIPRELIKPNPHQPRTVFDETDLAELANSIRQHGLIQPLIVTPNGEPDHFYLIAGERRWRAAGLIGLEVVPCIVRPRSADDLAQAELALIENVQRADLSAADEARAYDYLATQHGLSNEEIGRRVGKSRTTIANLRGLLRLPAAVLKRVGPGDGQIPQGVARSLAQIARIATPESIETTVDKMLAQPDLAERYLSIAINTTAIQITLDWADAWPDTPLTATDAAGDVQIPACRSCE